MRNNGCTQRIELTTREYEEVRGDPAAFAVAPTDDHVFQQIEDVVERKERYWVVQKTGPAAELATRVDPRRAGLRGGDGQALRKT